MIYLSDESVARTRHHIAEMVAGLIDYETWAYIDVDKLIRATMPKSEDIWKVLRSERDRRMGADDAE